MDHTAKIRECEKINRYLDPTRKPTKLYNVWLKLR